MSDSVEYIIGAISRHHVAGASITTKGKRTELCESCAESWPCSARIVLDRIDALTAERDELRSLLGDRSPLFQDYEDVKAERDAALARAEAAEARIAEIRDGIGAYRYWRTNDDVMMYGCRFCPSSREAVGAEGPHQHKRVCVLNPDYEAGMQAARKDIEARAALAARQEGGDE